MNKNFKKVLTVALILIGGVMVLVSRTPTTEKVFAENVFSPHRTSSNQEMPKDLVTLNKDSTSEYGNVIFDHQAHVSNKYSPDGKTDISCAECHHTDQPMSDLISPLLTSARKVKLTVDELTKENSPLVKGCGVCHFQAANIPENQEMPVAIYTIDGKEDKKKITNEIAYHINCNSCHDAAVKIRPKLKKQSGFATSKDCTVCHAKN
jgi:hypothetical protein